MIPTKHVAPDRDVKLQGHYAGFVSRLGGFVIDVLVIVLVYDLVTNAGQFLVQALTGHPARVSQVPVLSWLLLVIWALWYLIHPVGASGKTLGMAAVGLRVVSADGSPATARQAMVRVLALPLSFIILCYGFIMILVRADSRALHDRIGGTAVVYDWDARAARVRFLAGRTPTQ
jgi:uncharacterized RDD family membrane protein YckC